MPIESGRSFDRNPESLDDGVLLCSGGYDNVIKVWSAYSGTCQQRSLSHMESHVNCLHITPDRTYFVSGGYQTVRLYDIASQNNNPTITYDGLAKNVTSLGSNEKSTFLFTTGEDGFARIWDPRDCKNGNQCQRMFDAKAPLTSGCLHSNQTSLFLSDQKGSIHMWDVRMDDRTETKLLDKERSIQCVDIDPLSKNVVAVDNKGTMYFLRLDEPKYEKSPFFTECNTVLKINAHTRYGLKCRFTPDGCSIVTSSADKNAKIWDVEILEKALDDAPLSPIHDDLEFKDFECSPTMILQENSQRWVWDLAFTMDSKNVFTASSDNMVRLWNMKSGKIVREYSGHSKPVIALAFLDRAI